MFNFLKPKKKNQSLEIKKSIASMIKYSLLFNNNYKSNLKI